MFNFLRNCQMVFCSSCAILSSNLHYIGFQFFHVLTNTFIFQFFFCIIATLFYIKVGFHCALICTSLILKEMGIPDHLTCLLRNLYAGQEATLRTGHGTTDWLQIRKGVRQGCILSPCLFNLYAEYIMRNAGLEEAQTGIKIARRNINNLRYADDTHPYGRK